MSTANIAELQPSTYWAVHALSKAAHAAADEAGLDPSLVDLIKIRASQINGCAYCLQLHTAEALERGETHHRIAILGAWWDTDYFSEIEQAALLLTERVTRLADTPARYVGPVQPETHLSGQQFAAIAWLAILINTYNRIAIISHTAPTSPATWSGHTGGSNY